MASSTTTLGLGWNRNGYDLLPPSPDLEQQHQPHQQSVSVWPQSIRRRPILRALLQFAILFALGSLILGGTLYVARPPLDRSVRPGSRVLLLTLTPMHSVDKETFGIPTSFDELKALNVLLKKLKLLYPIRTMTCFIVTYF